MKTTLPVLLIVMLTINAATSKAQNTFPVTGRTGIYTTTPAASLDIRGGARIGAGTNYLKVDSATGNLTFVGGAGYRVAGNRYVFRYTADANYGLFFNSTDLLYEFRNSLAKPAFYINATNGNGVFGGSVQVGNTTTNVEGNIRWTGTDFEGYTETGWTSFTAINAGANTALSNLAGTTSVNADLLPASTNVRSLGSGTLRWKDINLYNLKFADGTTQTTASPWGVGGGNIYNNLTANVGIGTSTPGYRLEVSNNGAGPLLALRKTVDETSSMAFVTAFRDWRIGQNKPPDLPSSTDGFYIYDATANKTRLSISTLGQFQLNGATQITGATQIVGNTTISGTVAIGGVTPTTSLSVLNGLNVTGATSFLRMNASNSTGNTWSFTNDGYYAYVQASSTLGGGIVANFAIPSEPNQFTVWGNMIANNYNSSSDRKLKKNIQPLDKEFSALQIIKKLNAVSYDFKTDEYKSLNLPKRKQYGFIAQEIEEVLPNLVQSSKFPVSQDEKGNTVSEEMLSVNYLGIIPLLAQAIKEQQQTIDTKTEELKKQQDINNAQQKQIDALTTMMLQLKQDMQNCSPCAAVNTIPASSLVMLTNTASLEQNIPNPFTNNTVINYSLPQKFTTAQIIITDNNGKKLKQINVSGAGKGSLTIDAATLSAGAYHYSLLVDGKLIGTKQMIHSK